MKTIQRLGFSLLVFCTLLFAIDQANRYEPSSFPQNGTLADKSRYWAIRAEQLRKSASVQFEEGKESFGRTDLAAAEDCMVKAENFRDLHNRELGVNLWRSLTTVSSAPETAEYFQREYEMRKL